MSDILETTRASLERVSAFDVNTLPREVELGQHLAFNDAVAPAAKIVHLFREIPLTTLNSLPEKQLTVIHTQADAFYSLLDEILKFSSSEIEQPKVRRDALVEKVQKSFQSYFDHLFPLIAYAAGRMHDFSSLEAEGRATIQAIRDKTDEIQVALQTSQNEAEAILAEVREVAAEQGVSQQAVYFQKESEAHYTQAGSWRTATISVAVGLGCLALGSIFAHKIPFIAPANAYEVIQLTVSKVILFGVVAYILVLCARNFLSHTHNGIVNKQRQNALMTFETLVKAAGDEESKDVILTHAAACIFSPQDTGYAKAGSSPSSPPNASMIGLLHQLGRGQPSGT